MPLRRVVEGGVRACEVSIRVPRVVLVVAHVRFGSFQWLASLFR